MATSPAAQLSEAVRIAQAQRAAEIAAAVAFYYRTRVQVDNPSSVTDWLNLILPRILDGRAASARFAAVFGNQYRRLVLPKARDGFTFTPATGIEDETIRTSLAVVGAGELRGRIKKINELDKPTETKQQLIAKANESAATAVQGATARHVLNGGRDTIIGGTDQDRLALGYVRVTKDDPCYFCAMLASRGLVFAQDSFDESDPRFVGNGTAKVHDHCECGTEPVYKREGNEALAKSAQFFDLWKQAEHVGGAAQVVEFRRLYEGRKQYKAA